MKKIKKYILSALPPAIIITGTILVILFSRGWRLDVKEKTVINTGILDIISYPKGATLFLDGKNEGKTPTVVDSLSPGKHNVELRKENYSSWQKEIEIAEGSVLKIETNLFEEDTKLTQASDVPLEKVLFSKKGGEALLVSLRNGNQGILKIQLDPSVLFLKKTLTKIANLYEPDNYDLLTTDYSIRPSSNFTKAIVTVGQAESNPERSFLINLLSTESDLKEISEYLTNTTNIDWTRNDEYVLFGDNSSLYSFNTETFGKSVITERNYKNLWSISNDRIHYVYLDPISKSKNIFSANFDGTKREEIIIDQFSIENISLLASNTEYNILLLCDDTTLYTLDLKSREIKSLFENEIIIINFSPDQRYLLFKQNDDLYTYDFEYSKLSGPFNVPTENLIWTPNSLKLFYRYTDQNNKNIVGTLDPDGSNKYELLNLENYKGLLDKEIGFSSDSRKLYIPLLSNYIEKQDVTASGKFEEIVLFEMELR